MHDKEGNMLEAFVYIMELSLLCLSALLGYRTYHLYQRHLALETENKLSHTILAKLTHGAVPVNDAYDLKMAALKQAQIFSGIQLLPIKKRFNNLNQEKYQWLKKAAAYYLIGATEHIAYSCQGNTANHAELANMILKSNLGIPYHIAQKYLNSATTESHNQDLLALYKTGLKASESWLKSHNVPQHMSLEEHLNRNALMI
jgi:hypothetical protein